ncbi:MAG: diaminopimelate epimerase [Coriobacteriia bacterium]|nr:diaminopimelate epimerase [Coriobacteriia bacterium]
MDIRFTKMHGLGNDFLVIEDLAEELDLAPEAVTWFCDRHFGIGGDGLILVRPARVSDAEFFMLYYNADGTTAEMCGNGIRCFAKYLVDHGHLAADSDSVRVQTLGGIKPITFTRDEDGRLLMATVDMGEPGLAPSQIPTTLPGESVYDCALETELGTFNITAVSMGNPHAVMWVDDVDCAPVDTVGPLIETHPAFPAKTNVEFAQYVGDETIRLRVWERGVGETLACGTGACATLVAATLACYVGRFATIELPGGELSVRWDEDGHVYMTGPATEVFTGHVTIPDEGDTSDS